MDLAREFPILERSTFLKHAAVAPLPRRALDALAAYAEDAACLELAARMNPSLTTLDARLHKAAKSVGIPALEIYAIPLIWVADSEI
jgi:predicted nucleic acid-binding protein